MAQNKSLNTSDIQSGHTVNTDQTKLPSIKKVNTIKGMNLNFKIIKISFGEV